MILRWLAFGLLVIPAVLRACVMLSPDLYFTSNPRIMPTPLDGLGPAGTMTLDLISLIGMVLAMVAELRSGRRLERLMTVGALLPVVAIIIHARSDAESLRVGMHWLAAMATAVGALHLGRDVTIRVTMIGAFGAMVIPLVTKGLYQVVVEHGITADEYQRTKAMVLESHGWASDSPAARLYERRLLQREATGWFGLSNVYGSILGSLVPLWIVTTLVTTRSKLASGWIGLAGIVTGAAMVGATLSFSKGGIGVTLIAIIMCVFVIVPRGMRRKAAALTGLFGAAMVAMAIVGVVIRGALLGESFSADGYSLLFRWHYWQGAARMIAEHPIFGVGPGGFKAAYLIHKPPTSPEEVTLAHNVFITWLSTLGMFGIAWCLVAWRLLWESSPAGARRRHASLAQTEETQRPLEVRTWWIASTATGVIALGAAWILNWPATFLDFKVLFWPLAMIGFVGTMVLLPFAGRHTSWGLLRWGAWLAGLVVVTHSQIEMTLTQVGSASLPFLLLGALAAFDTDRLVAEPPADDDIGIDAAPAWPVQWRCRPVDSGIASIAVVVTLAMALVCWLPMVRSQRAVRDAYFALFPLGETYSALSAAMGATDIDDMVDALRVAQQNLADQGFEARIDGPLRELQTAMQMGDTGRIRRVQGTILEQLNRAIAESEANALPVAIERLEAAAQAMPQDVESLREAAGLWLHLAMAYQGSDDMVSARDAMVQANSLAAEMINRRPDKASVYAFAASIESRHALVDPASGAIDRAIEYQERTVELDPYSVAAAYRMAQLLDQAGKRVDAVVWYRRTLELDGLIKLDPLKQLDDRTRAQIERRLSGPEP